MNEKNSKNKKGMSMKGQRTLAYIVLIIISFFCLFWFYVLFINARNTPCMEWYVQQYFHCYLLRCFMYLFFNNDCLRYPCIQF